MKSRDRQASGGNVPQGSLAAAVLKEPSNGSGPAPSYQVNGAGTVPWEDWYRLASPHQQAELLELARRQGLLYAYQIPSPTNGQHHHENGHESTADAQILKDLLAANVATTSTRPAAIEKLVPVEVPIVEVVDQELDPLQRQAVARALATPDICLIQGPPGTGKSRVVQEILVQASQQGLRVLFLAQNPACVDGVLEQFTGLSGPQPIRLTGAGEEVPAALQPMVLDQRVRSFRTEVVEKANLSRSRSEEQCRERQRQSELWPAFTALLEQRGQTEARLRTIGEELAKVAATVDSQADSILGVAWQLLPRKKLPILNFAESLWKKRTRRHSDCSRRKLIWPRRFRSWPSRPG